jgi:hypothetical protein
MRLHGIFLASSVFMAAVGSDCYAGFEQSLDLTGSVRSSFYSHSARLDGNSDVVSSALWIKASPTLSENTAAVVEAWVRNDDLMHGEQFQPRIRESYLRFSQDDLDIKIGKQIIIWGRADYLNPTDKITPRNYNWMTPEGSDQRFGVMAAKTSFHFENNTITGIFLPTFVPNTLPMLPPAGAYFVTQFDRRNQWAVKFDHTGDNLDWSLSYYDGLDLDPDTRIGPTTVNGLEVELVHLPIRMLGADAASVIGNYGLHAEAAYTWTSNEGSGDMLTKRPFFYLVAGTDRTFGDNLNINLQFYLRYINNYQDPHTVSDPLLQNFAFQNALFNQQLDRVQHGYTLRIADKWFHEALQGEISAIYSADYHDYAIKAKAVYAIDDNWSVTSGSEIYRGNSNSFYGRLRDISTVFAEIKYSF